MNVFEVSEKLVNHIRSNCPDDIAIIAYYGSYAQGTATKRSDLDFFFIPATSKGYRASIQFIVDDICFDFWPISWERAERMALFEEPQTSIIVDSKLLYVRSEEDRKRFINLRHMTSTLQEPEYARKLVERAESVLRNVYVHLYKLSHAGRSETIIYYRTEAHGVLTNVLQCIALLNRTYFTKGFGKHKEQMMQFPLKPDRLESYMHTIMHSSRPTDIIYACEQLTADTLTLIRAQKEKHSAIPSYSNTLKGFYEEEKAIFDKIITACECNDYDTAYFNAIHVQDEISRFLYRAETGHWPCPLVTDSSYQDIYKRVGLPELVTLLHSSDLSQLKSAVQRLSTWLESYLLSKGVKINRFQNVDQFEQYLIDYINH